MKIQNRLIITIRLIDALFVVVVCIVSLICGLFFFGAVIDLLKMYVGWFAYILWIFVAPIMSPVAFGLPWFDAWVHDSAVNERVFLAWLAWWIILPLKMVSGFLREKVD